MDPSRGQAKAGRTARNYIQHLCEGTGCSLEDLPEAMHDRGGKRGPGISVLVARQGDDEISWVIPCALNKFPDRFVQAFKIPVLLKIQYVIAIQLLRWLTNFYDVRFKWTTTAAIRIHPTKAWLSQLVNFKNPIWTWGHFRRTIWNKILF